MQGLFVLMGVVAVLQVSSTLDKAYRRMRRRSR